jgi:hypothetical protein
MNAIRFLAKSALLAGSLLSVTLSAQAETRPSFASLQAQVDTLVARMATMQAQLDNLQARFNAHASSGLTVEVITDSRGLFGAGFPHSESISCPSGRAVAGAAVAHDAYLGRDFAVTSMVPINESTWQATATGSNGFSINLYLVCAKMG